MVAERFWDDPGVQTAKANHERLVTLRVNRSTKLGLRDTWRSGVDPELDSLIAESRDAMSVWDEAVTDWCRRYLVEHAEEIRTYLRGCMNGSATMSELRAYCPPIKATFGQRHPVPGCEWRPGKQGHGWRLTLNEASR